MWDRHDLPSDSFNVFQRDPRNRRRRADRAHHEALLLTRAAPHRVAVLELSLLGVCAGVLRSPLWWDVDLLFFEACVREIPKDEGG